MTDTLKMLQAALGGPSVPLSQVAAQYLGITSRKAMEMAAKDQLPLPCFRLGSQKSPWMVHLDDLAQLIDRKAQEAREARHGI